MQRLPDPAREVRVRSGDLQPLAHVFDGHDPLQRMLGLLHLLLALDEGHDLVAVVLDEFALDHHVTGRKLVADALARGAHVVVRILGNAIPCPAAVREHGLATGTDSGFGRLVSDPVGVFNPRDRALSALRGVPGVRLRGSSDGLHASWTSRSGIVSAREMTNVMSSSPSGLQTVYAVSWVTRAP